MAGIWDSLLGPELYQIYQKNGFQSHVYEKNIAESFSGSVLKLANIIWSYKTWLSPMLIFFAHRKGTLNSDGASQLLLYLLALALLLATSNIIRALGRFLSSEYRAFLTDLKAFQLSPTPLNKQRLLQYDFSFSAWPVEYQAPDLRGRYRPKDNGGNFLLNLLSGAFVNTVGVKLLYPGSVSLMQSMLATPLREGREKLITQHNGQRVKIRTSDGNHIDTIFIDRRSSNTAQGRKLVVCSEGNACFYEIGCMATPMEAGFSVLGWNHPGFACSTGQPLPAQEQAAVDAVMQFGTNVLSFQPHDMVLFAWSIGGYTASWAAMMYPDVHSVVLDASFDHIRPLALFHMPQSWAFLIDFCISKHLNLNNAQLLCRYPGRLGLIRRTNDETIATSESSPLTSNRGNNLLMEVFKHRYPHLMDQHGEQVLEHWFSLDKTHLSETSKDDAFLTDTFPSDLGAGEQPEKKGEILLSLARQYMVDFKATHCKHLPYNFFRDLSVFRSL